MLYRLILIALLTVSSSGIFAQMIMGYVEDEIEKEPVAFANVWIKGTTQGTMTDVNGKFKIEAPETDTLCISSVGYIAKEIPIKKDRNTQLSVFLQLDVKTIGEVTVKPEEPFAKVLFKQILKHKKENREKLNSVGDYKSMAMTSVYMAIDSASKINRVIDNLEEVTVTLDDQSLRFSPVYLAEQAINNSNGRDSVVHNKKRSIFPRLNPIIESVILLNIVVDLDFYKDQINILDRGFISPLNNSAMLYYNLYFNDSIFVDNKKYYSFSFTPKNKYNQLFTGHFMVESENYALTEIEAFISPEANLNYINGFKGSVRYKKLQEGYWFYDEQEIRLNMSLTLNKDSVSGYNSQRVDNIASGNWLINKSTLYSTSAHLDEIKAEEWKNQPEFASNQLEQDSYARVDKLKEQTIVKSIDGIGGLALTSYLNAGKIDIGPVFDIYSTNAIEGNRFTVPLRTSEKMFKYFSVGGFLGYGTKNKEFKYGMNLVFQPQKTDRFIFRINYSNDYTLVTHDKYLRFIKYNPNNKGNGNFISIFTTSERNPYLKEEESFELRFELNTKKDIHLEASPYYLSNTTTPVVPFVRKGITYEHYKNYGMLINCRLTFGQHYDKFFFDRIYYVNRIPVVNLSWDIGQTLLPDQSMKNAGIYSQFHGSIQGRLIMGQVFMNYIVNAGYLFGDAPYDLLDQPVGSMSLGYSKDRFNLLHHAAFAHNLYSNTHLHLNGGGIILNRVPLIKKLKLREIVSFKYHYGTLEDSYKGVFDLPEYYASDQNTSYAEIGFGLTNILKVLRVEYVHQLGNTYIDSDFTDVDGLRFRAEMSF